METEKYYDYVIIGSGLGGLACALILAKEGKKVCVLEKNNQYGGSLQTFVRKKHIFDTGVHYIGGLNEGQNLHSLFKYFGLNELKLSQMNNNGFDYISFDDDEIEYPHAQGYDNFVEQLSKYFPDERENLKRYIQKVKDICDSFPLYNLDSLGSYQDEVLSESLSEGISKITSNKKLQSILIGSNLLYVGMENVTPFYIHALIANSYILSAYRCIQGGSQITKLLLRELRKYGVELYKYVEIEKLKIENDRVLYAKTVTGNKIKGENFISNVDIKKTYSWIDSEQIKKIVKKKVDGLDPLPSSFNLHIVFKDKSFPYKNFNHYHFKKQDYVLNAHVYDANEWPKNYMMSFGIDQKNQEWATTASIITFMDYKEVENWHSTHNTIFEKSERGIDYQDFKQKKIGLILNEVEKKYPNFRDHIAYIDTSTPLTFRDYIGGTNGNLYGYIKDCNHIMKSIISAKTRYENLFLTGQSVNLHGVLGVSIGAVNTCAEILGREYLIHKIKEATSQV